MDKAEYAARRTAEKQSATDQIEQVLATLTASGREPDSWERDSIAFALRACFSGFYQVALSSCEIAMTPPDHRAPMLQQADGEGFTVTTLREALALAQFEPAR